MLLALSKLRNLPIKLIILIILFMVTGFLIGYLARILKNFDCFKIKDIVISEGEVNEFFYLKDHNIFEIDLRKESRYISQIYPTYKRIRLIRVLPNRLFIDFIRRRPLAYIKLYRYFCIDEEQVLFDVPDGFKEEDLPIILGLETKIFGPKVGEEYDIKELSIALNIIKELRRNRVLKDYRLKIINLAKPTEISLFLEGGLELKVGQHDIKNKINILNTLFTQMKKELDNIKYIDLRFKEPVIKFKR